MKKQLFVRLVPVLIALSGCERDFDIELPPNTSELVIECYLEAGRPFRALVTESAALLDTSIIPPLVFDAVVVISFNNRKDTLVPFAYLDTLRRRAYNFGSNTLPEVDYTIEYRLDVTDSRGRRASAVTRFIPPVPIDTLTPVFNDKNEAYCLTEFTDDPTTANYYRLVTHRNDRYDSLQQETLLDDNFANDNNKILWGSAYDYKQGDSIFSTLYHLTPDYYRYLSSLQNAQGALVNPFAASGEVVSNIRGGLGIFTTLNTSEKMIIVR